MSGTELAITLVMNLISEPCAARAEHPSKAPSPRRKPKIPFWLSLGPLYVFAALFVGDKYMQHRGEIDQAQLNPQPTVAHEGSVPLHAGSQCGDGLSCRIGDPAGR